MDKTCLRKSETLLFGGEPWHLKTLSFLSTCSNEINFSQGKREASLLYKHGKFSVEIYNLAAAFSGHLAHAQCILSRMFKDIAIVFFWWIQHSFGYLGKQQVRLFITSSSLEKEWVFVSF